MRYKKFNIVLFAVVAICLEALLIFQVHVSHANGQPKPLFRYLFFQQRVNSMCTIAPMLNLHRLQFIRKLHHESKKAEKNFIETAFKDEKLALTSQQWFGEGHAYLFSWRKFLVELMHTDIGHKYFKAAAADGLVTPHFYTKDGTLLCESEEEVATYPYFFVDLPKLPKFDEDTGFCIPITNKNLILSWPHNTTTGELDEKNFETDGWKIYNSETKKFEPISSETKKIESVSIAQLKSNPIYASIKASLMARQPQSTPQSLARNWRRYKKPRCGFASIAKPHLDWEESFEGKMPYCLGFLKLMFLSLGINNDNKVMDTKDPDYLVSQTMKKLIQADEAYNPWSERYFKKEDFMQYALAEIFKADEKLYAKAAKVVEIAGPKSWEAYEQIITGKLGLYKDVKGTAYDLKALTRYLPGRHQALAYFISNRLSHLWYGAASNDAIALYKALGISSLPNFIRWWKNLSYSQIKSKAAEEVEKGLSFLSVWAELKKELLKRYPKTIDWINFGAHGWVISFDEELIKQQRAIAQQKEKGCDYELLDKLGFAGIDSWLGFELEVFYKDFPIKNLPKDKAEKEKDKTVKKGI